MDSGLLQIDPLMSLSIHPPSHLIFAEKDPIYSPNEDFNFSDIRLSNSLVILIIESID